MLYFMNSDKAKESRYRDKNGTGSWLCQYCVRGGCYRRNRLWQSHLGQQLIDEIIIRGLLALRFCSSSRIHRTFTLLVIIKYVSDANHETRG